MFIHVSKTILAQVIQKLLETPNFSTYPLCGTRCSISEMCEIAQAIRISKENIGITLITID